MTQKGLISCIIPSYNRQERLEKCISSLVQQAYSSIEIIIINDGGPLNLTGEIFLDSRVRILTNKYTKGAQGARNTGLDEAKGEFIYLIDDDDYVLPFFTSVLPLLEKHFVVSSSCFYIDQTTLFQIHHYATLEPSHMLFENRATTGSFIYRNTPSLRFDESLSSCQDWDFAIALIRHYGYFHVLNIPFFCKNDADEDRIGKNPTAKLAGHKALLEKYADILTLREKNNHLCIFYNLSANFESDRKKKAAFLAKAFSHAPGLYKKGFILLKLLLHWLRINA